MVLPIGLIPLTENIVELKKIDNAVPAVQELVIKPLSY
jgi:hypothetical protein